jgi:hypothetical protein
LIIIPLTPNDKKQLAELRAKRDAAREVFRATSKEMAIFFDTAIQKSGHAPINKECKIDESGNYFIITGRKEPIATV